MLAAWSPKFLRQENTTGSLVQGYALLSFVSIAAVSAVSGVVLYGFLKAHLLERDATVSSEFIQSVVHVNDLGRYFTDADTASSREALTKFFAHITEIPFVLRANVFSADREILWSSNDKLIGTVLSENESLEAALNGERVFHLETIEDHTEKPLDDISEFLESYIPIFDTGDPGRVIGVVEIYKAPTLLNRMLIGGGQLVTLVAVASGAFIFITLFWFVRRAGIVITRQREQLLENERMAAVGVMSSAIAHNIRNPLASIRSSAELTLHTDSSSSTRESAQEIIEQVDLLNERIKELLTYSNAAGSGDKFCDGVSVLRDVVTTIRNSPCHSNVAITCNFDKSSRHVVGDKETVSRVFESVLGNALEALNDKGTIHVHSERLDEVWQVTIVDNGTGISKEMLPRVFDPFVTGKANGLGLGLPLTQRLLNSVGGGVSIESQPGRTMVSLSFPVYLPC